jgi:CHAD domain-containing protein
MSYRLYQDEPVPLGTKRIAYEQIDDALTYLQDSAEDLDEAVHETRKCLKKLRGLLRLVRKEIGETVYQRENVAFRDAGRLLSDLRDSKVMVDTLDDHVEALDDEGESDAFGSLRKSLEENYQRTRRRAVQEENALSAAAAMIQAARLRVQEWPVERDSYDAVAGGLHKIYKRGRNRLADARQNPSSEAFHEWRKRVKYLWYSSRILRFIWPDPMEELADEIHDLSDYLGDAHDIAELKSLLTERSLISDKATTLAFISRLNSEQEALHERAINQGRRIYWESPDDFVDRFGAYWKLARS